MFFDRGISFNAQYNLPEEDNAKCYKCGNIISQDVCNALGYDDFCHAECVDCLRWNGEISNSDFEELSKVNEISLA